MMTTVWLLLHKQTGHETTDLVPKKVS